MAPVLPTLGYWNIRGVSLYLFIFIQVLELSMQTTAYFIILYLILIVLIQNLKLFIEVVNNSYYRFSLFRNNSLKLILHFKKHFH
jgi:hypothetical protein